MKRFVATNTIPVTRKVMSTVKSTSSQLEASGVKYQGLRKWNRMVPTTNKIITTATSMRYGSFLETSRTDSAPAPVETKPSPNYSTMNLPFMSTKWPGKEQKYV